MAAAQGFRAHAPANPRQTRQHRAGRRADHAERKRQRVAGSGCRGRESAVLGRPKRRQSFGDAYVERLFAAFDGRVPAEADLVAYWFAKASGRMRDGRLKRAGLVATQAIRRGASRKVLDRIAQSATIYDAWADEPWVLEGAAVRVSLICFGIDVDTQFHLSARPQIIESTFDRVRYGFTTIFPYHILWW